MIKAYIFDLDNTLHDRFGAYEKYSVDFLNRYFPNNSKDDFAIKYNDMIQYDNNGYSNRLSVFSKLIAKWNWTEGPTPDTLVNDYYAEFYKLVYFTPNMENVLQTLKAKGYMLGIITNGPQTQHNKIDILGIRSLFDIIVVSNEVGVEKPGKEIFNIACQQLNILNEEACYVGDHFTNDVIGATNAGLRAIWYTYRGYPKKIEKALIPLNTLVIEDINELIELI